MILVLCSLGLRFLGLDLLYCAFSVSFVVFLLFSMLLFSCSILRVLFSVLCSLLDILKFTFTKSRHRTGAIERASPTPPVRWFATEPGNMCYA